MGLAGELSTIGLAEVFQNLAFNHHSGTLTLVEAGRKARICFEEGKIRAVKLDDESFDFVEIATQAGAAPAESLERARTANRRRTVRAFLRAAGAFDEAAFDDMAAGYVQETLLPLFGWATASFSFEEGKLKERVFGKELLDCNVQLDPLGVAMEAARRHDEWETIEPYMPKESQILVLAAGAPTGEMTREQQIVLPLLDGTRNLGAVVEEAPLKKFEVFKAVAQLVEGAWLIPASAERLTELARRAMTAGRISLAAARLETALEIDPGDAEARRELVRLHERGGRKRDAAEALVRLAELQVERGDLAGSVESYERATVLAPRDLDVLERVFEMHGSLGNAALAVKAGRRLAEALVAQEMYEDALPLYERLLQGNEGNAALRESLAHCLIQCGDSAGAAAHLLQVADRMHDRGEFDVSLKYYRRVLALDAECPHAAARVEEIESGAARVRRRFRKRRRLMVVVGVALGFCLLQGAREWFAQGALHTAQLATVDTLGRDNTDGQRVSAMRRYAAVTEAYPYTRGAAHADETLHTLLLAEISRLTDALRLAEKATTTADVEYRLVRAQELIVGLGTVRLSAESSAHWEKARDRLLARIEELRAR